MKSNHNINILLFFVKAKLTRNSHSIRIATNKILFSDSFFRILLFLEAVQSAVFRLCCLFVLILIFLVVQYNNSIIKSAFHFR